VAYKKGNAINSYKELEEEDFELLVSLITENKTQTKTFEAYKNSPLGEIFPLEKSIFIKSYEKPIRKYLATLGTKQVDYKKLPEIRLDLIGSNIKNDGDRKKVTAAPSFQEVEEARSKNSSPLTSAIVFFFALAIWVKLAGIALALFAAPLIFLFRRFTKPHASDYIVKGKGLAAGGYTRKGAYWNALQVWFLSVVVTLPLLFTPGFCRTEAFTYEEQNFLSRTTPREWFKSGNSYKADSRTVRRKDESCYDDQILWSIKNQPVSSAIRLASVLGFLYTIVCFLRIRPKPKKGKKKKTS
jgi:hypothetical protein